jgi:hypothetical protein
MATRSRHILLTLLTASTLLGSTGVAFAPPFIPPLCGEERWPHELVCQTKENPDWALEEAEDFVEEQCANAPGNCTPGGAVGYVMETADGCGAAAFDPAVIWRGFFLWDQPFAWTVGWGWCPKDNPQGQINVLTCLIGVTVILETCSSDHDVDGTVYDVEVIATCLPGHWSSTSRTRGEDSQGRGLSGFYSSQPTLIDCLPRDPTIGG